MFHLVYISHAAYPLSQENLMDILRSSRQYNTQHHITGMLLYLNEKFIQVLEGSYDAVREVYHRIQKDPRHRRLSILLEGNTEHRIFKDWSMGFKQLDNEEFEQMSGYKDPEEFFAARSITNNSPAVLIFLSLFYQRNINDYPETAAVK